MIYHKTRLVYGRDDNLIRRVSRSLAEAVHKLLIFDGNEQNFLFRFAKVISGSNTQNYWITVNSLRGRSGDMQQVLTAKINKSKTEREKRGLMKNNSVPL